MMRKLMIFAALAGVVAAVAKKVKSANDERELWHEATTAPDLR